MDPVQKMWMFMSWVEDQKEKSEVAKNHAYLIGGFTNPEALRKILEDNQKIESSDEAFEESLKLIREDVVKEQQTKPRRKKRKIRNN